VDSTTPEEPPVEKAPPIPDLGFFGGPPRTGTSTFASQPSSTFGAPPTSLFGTVPASPQFGTIPIPSQFGPPPAAPPFGAPPVGYYPAAASSRGLGGLPAWAIVLIAVPVVLVLVGILAAIAIPVFLDQRAKALDAATTVVFPASIENLPRQTGIDAKNATDSVLNALPRDFRDAQAGIYSDGSTHQIVVLSMRPPKGSGRIPIDASVTDFWAGARHGTPTSVTMSEPVDRDAGRLGGRMSCATLTGASTGQICVAVDSIVLVAVFDLSPSQDRNLPLRVREAVVHRS
jgi:type II secretory pathway pseudopilin PulG